MDSSDDETSQNTRRREATQNIACVRLFSTEIQVSLQPKELSLDTATIPWLGHLKFEYTIQGK
jgi:hypothetical protein